jgi:hypothetical protein
MLKGVVATRLVRLAAVMAITAAASAVVLVPATAANADTCSLQVGGPTPGGGYEYSSYSGTLFTSGGVAPYSYALASGSLLPLGLGMNKQGIISGVPLQTATPATFDVQVVDSSPTPCTAVIQAQLVVYPNSDIPSTDRLVQILENLGTYGPECVLSTVNTLGGGGPPDSDCIGLI